VTCAKSPWAFQRSLILVASRVDRSTHHDDSQQTEKFWSSDLIWEGVRSEGMFEV